MTTSSPSTRTTDAASRPAQVDRAAPEGDAAPTLDGGCLCGRVRYRLTGPLGRTGHCHCSICRRAHGAPLATWALLGSARFAWTAGADELTGYASSPGRQRLFCRHCGSPLAATHHGAVGEVVLASIDGDPQVRPLDHIFVGSKACWYRLDDGLPQHEA